MTDSVYRPTRVFCEGILTRFGVQTTYYDPLIGAGIEKLIQKNTTVIFLESPGSQSFETQDVPAITTVAKKYGIRTIIDNTWTTPVFFRAHEMSCDLSLEAGTKYLSEHSDLLLGVASANEEAWPALRAAYAEMAMLPGAEDCFLALRGLRTMHIRLKEAEARALDMAKWLKARPEVKTVLHPAFPECPGHEFWKRDFTGSTGLFSIILQPEYSKKAVAAMLDHMSIFSMGYSWGAFESLVIIFDCASYRTATEWNPGGVVLHLQIGLEDMEDLKKDLDAGFARMRKV